MNTTTILSILPCGLLAATAAIAPKFLYTPTSASSGVFLQPSTNVVVSTCAEGAIITFNPSNAGYPGVAIVPVDGKPWDLSPWGHVEATLTNMGEKPVHISLRLDNKGDWRDNPWNTESVMIKPGETRVLPVYFGYQYGYQPSDYDFKSNSITQVLLFTGKSVDTRIIRMEELKATGYTGEKPPVEPNRLVVKLADGIIAGFGARIEPEPKVSTTGNSKIVKDQSGAYILSIPAGEAPTVALRPSSGFWDLGDWTDIECYVRDLGLNTGDGSFSLQAISGRTNSTIVASEIITKARGPSTVVCPFAPAKHWQGQINKGEKSGRAASGTGTEFESHRVNAVMLKFSATTADRQISIDQIRAIEMPAQIPDWLGKRPPVAGDWKLTLNEDFSGTAIDRNLWNIYTSNFWDNRTHFTATNTIVRNGKLHLRYSCDKGWHNDNPEDKSKVKFTGYACGYADTFGKWTQCYGYFEARMKLPTCPGLWPAFWMMPDRGEKYAKENGLGPEQWHRNGTTVDKNGGMGMEFDIMEHLTAWGPHRFNIACHWDGYYQNHSTLGTSGAYVRHDDEGYITVGMLWLPGEFHVYSNGEKVAEWYSERISNLPAYPILYMVSGGWANAPLDKSRLPDEFVIDYLRVWQRADLASDIDGYKNN